jgi:hypothetical protein
MALSRKALATLVALATATEGAPSVIIRGTDGHRYRIPDVLLHSDQGVYRPGGAQIPFRRGARSYVLVRRVPVAPDGFRLVLLDETFTCGSRTLSQLVDAAYLVAVADGHGYVLTALGCEAAARARCMCGHPLEEHDAQGCTLPDPSTANGKHICPCPYRSRPIPVQVGLDPA